MKDKDTQLIWEQYNSPGRRGDPKDGIPFPDGKGEISSHRLSKSEVVDHVKAKFDMDVEWDEETRKWLKLNDLTGEYTIVTGDEKMDIWSVEDPDSYEQHKAEGEGMRKQLSQAGHGSDEEVFPPENGRRY